MAVSLSGRSSQVVIRLFDNDTHPISKVALEDWQCHLAGQLPSGHRLQIYYKRESGLVATISRPVDEANPKGDWLQALVYLTINEDNRGVLTIDGVSFPCVYHEAAEMTSLQGGKYVAHTLTFKAAPDASLIEGILTLREKGKPRQSYRWPQRPPRASPTSSPPRWRRSSPVERKPW